MKGNNCIKTFVYLFMLTKPFDFPFMKGELVNKAATIYIYKSNYNKTPNKFSNAKEK